MLLFCFETKPFWERRQSQLTEDIFGKASNHQLGLLYVSYRFLLCPKPMGIGFGVWLWVLWGLFFGGLGFALILLLLSFSLRF